MSVREKVENSGDNPDERMTVSYGDDTLVDINFEDE